MKTTIFITIPKSAFDDDFVHLSVADVKELQECLEVARQTAESESEEVDVVITHKSRQSQYSLEIGPTLVEELFVEKKDD